MAAFVLALLGPVAVSAQGSRELYAVGVYEGSQASAVDRHGTEARVVIDRPGMDVSLTLGSYEPVTWKLESTEGTRIEQVLLHGYGAEGSTVLLDGVAYTGHELAPELRASYSNHGMNFRALVAHMPGRLGFDLLDGFRGGYQAPDRGFVIAGESRRDPRLRGDYLTDLVRPDAVPPELRDRLEPGAAPQSRKVSFDQDGFTLTGGGERRKRFGAPWLSWSLPEISWPVGAAYDPEGGRLFGVTLGGEGYLYQVEQGSGRWSVLSSMENFDASGMLFDAAGDRLIIGGGIHGPGLAVYDFDGGLRWSELDRERFAGLTDLYEPGNGPEPGLEPVAVAGELVLLRARPPHFGRQRTELIPGPSRTYLLDMATGEVTLVGMSD